MRRTPADAPDSLRRAAFPQYCVWHETCWKEERTAQPCRSAPPPTSMIRDTSTQDVVLDRAAERWPSRRWLVAGVVAAAAIAFLVSGARRWSVGERSVS